MPTEDTETLASVLERLETTISIASLGYMPDTDKPREQRWPHFAYRVTVLRGGQSYATDYKSGIGHAKTMPDTYRRDLPEHQRREAWYGEWRTPIHPTVADVVASLMVDAQCGAETFEGYCDSMGLDTDSRKAFDTYLLCQAALNGCRLVFGEHFEAVAAACQDY